MGSNEGQFIVNWLHFYLLTYLWRGKPLCETKHTEGKNSGTQTHLVWQMKCKESWVHRTIHSVDFEQASLSYWFNKSWGWAWIFSLIFACWANALTNSKVGCPLTLDYCLHAYFLQWCSAKTRWKKKKKTEKKALALKYYCCSNCCFNYTVKSQEAAGSQLAEVRRSRLSNYMDLC